MKRFFFLLATLFALCFTWTGCSDGGDDANGGTGNGGGSSSALSLSKDELEFDSNEGYQTIKVTSNGEWEVTGGSDWCDISPSKGKTGETVTISVEANTTDEDRTVTYTFKCGSQTAKLTVLQYGIIETSYVDLKIDDENTSVAYNEQTGETVIVYKSGAVPDAEIGQAFVLSEEHDYDIRKITGVTKSSGKLTLQTEQGNMCDLFKNITFTLTTNPDLVTTSRNVGRVITPTSIEIVKGNKRSVIFDKNAITSREVYERPIKIFDFNKDFSGVSLFMKDDGISGEYKWERWKSIIGLDAVFQFDFGEKISNNTKIGDLKYFKYYLQGNIDLDLLLSFETQAEAFNFSIPEEKETVKKNILPTLIVTFPVGIVPVIIALETDLKQEGGISCSGSLKTSAGFKFHAETKLGKEYDVRTREVHPITEFNPLFELHSPTFEINASLEATFGYYPHLQFHFHKFLGPYLDIKPLYSAGIEAGSLYDSETKEEYHGWHAAIGTKITVESGLELKWGLDEAEFKFFEKDLKEATLFEAPASIILETPENGHQMKVGEEVEVCFHVYGKNHLTEELYDCPGASVQYYTELLDDAEDRSVNNNREKKYATTDTNGRLKIKWSPRDKSEYLVARIIKGDEVIDKVEFKPEINDKRLTLLEAIYRQTNGDNWINKENWFSDKPIDDWYGVHTDSTGLFITSLELADNNLTGALDLTNIEGFSKEDYYILMKLIISGNKLTSLNVSGYKNLGELACSNSQLTELNASNCYRLSDLQIDDSPLININLSNCGVLASFPSHSPELKVLNLSGCVTIENLWIPEGHLTSLNINDCSALKTVEVSKNQLTTLQISGCHALENVSCSYNQLTSLNVAGYKKLKTISCSNNQLTSLNVEGCTALENLYCENNSISREIPSWFSQLNHFYYDQRYTNYWWKNIYWDGHLIDTELQYDDNGVGWWYPGEPSKGYHRPN